MFSGPFQRNPPNPDNIAAETQDAQWRLYGGAGGVAIVSTLQRLYNAVSFSPHTGMLSNVHYVDFDSHPMRHPMGTMVRTEFLKRKAFEHEREVRGVIQLEVNEPSIASDDTFLEMLRTKRPLGLEADVVLTELLEQIVLSPVAPPYMEFIVRRLTARHGLDHLVRKSNLCGIPSF